MLPRVDGGPGAAAQLGSLISPSSAGPHVVPRLYGGDVTAIHDARQRLRVFKRQPAGWVRCRGTGISGSLHVTARWMDLKLAPQGLAQAPWQALAALRPSSLRDGRA